MTEALIINARSLQDHPAISREHTMLCEMSEAPGKPLLIIVKVETVKQHFFRSAQGANRKIGI